MTWTKKAFIFTAKILDSFQFLLQISYVHKFVWAFFFLQIMKLSFPKVRQKFKEKSHQTSQPVNESNLSLKTSFDSKYLTSLNKDPVFLGKLFQFSAHIATPFHIAQWCTHRNHRFPLSYGCLAVPLPKVERPWGSLSS